MNAIVSDFRTLKGMERQGFVILRGGPNSRERHWTGLQVKVITVKPGDRLNDWGQPFTYRGNQYRIEYFDGCFHPFVTRVGVAKPAFV